MKRPGRNIREERGCIVHSPDELRSLGRSDAEPSRRSPWVAVEPVKRSLGDKSGADQMVIDVRLPRHGYLLLTAMLGRGQVNVRERKRLRDVYVFVLKWRMLPGPPGAQFLEPHLFFTPIGILIMTFKHLTKLVNHSKYSATK